MRAVLGIRFTREDVVEVSADMDHLYFVCVTYLAVFLSMKMVQQNEAVGKLGWAWLWVILVGFSGVAAVLSLMRFIGFLLDG